MPFSFCDEMSSKEGLDIGFLKLKGPIDYLTEISVIRPTAVVCVTAFKRRKHCADRIRARTSKHSQTLSLSLSIYIYIYIYIYILSLLGAE